MLISNMNFKPTKFKILGSLLVPVILSFRLHKLFFPCKPIVTDIPGLTADPICAFTPTYALGNFWWIVIVLLVLTYVIWSLIEKK